MSIYKGDCLDCGRCSKVQGFFVCSYYNLIVELAKDKFEGECEHFKYEDNL